MTTSEINILLGQSERNWEEIVANIFAPRGVNSLVASDAAEALEILSRCYVHTAIVDMDAAQRSGGFGLVKVVRKYHPRLPFIMFCGSLERKELGLALELNAFSVIAKPVDMTILQDELNRLFRKIYNSMVFSDVVN
jgi:DNA-binding NtrC family response regulator